MATITANEDLLAIDAYRHAEQTGQTLTIGLVERRLDELRGHAPSCGCGLCAAAAKVRARGVWYVVRGWQSGLVATRRHAAR